MTPGERLMVEMRAWVEAGGDRTRRDGCGPPKGTDSASSSAGRRRGELQLTDTQWAELETLGTGAR